MRTTAPLAFVFCLGLAAAIFAGSGFNGLVDGDRNTGQLQEQISEEANASAANGSLEGSDQGTQDSSIIGMVLSGSREVARYVGMVVMLPWTLIHLGFPTWFAFPIGSVIEIVASIGLIQFITGRDWR